MKTENLFKKDINRAIETVIKADDQEHIFTEVDEYVVTKEIGKKIADFFDDYKDYTGANGVWISGFFGSGKSHLLKILSYVLENKEYNGVQLGEVFADKVKEDAMLYGNVLQATRIPSESILFNIDQQAQITSKTDEDAILNVFYKVLNDHQGYYGAQCHVAEFERWLDSEGVYKRFMDLFEEYAQEHWTAARRKYFAPKIKEAIGKALGDIYNDDAKKYENIIDTLQKDSKISVEDFCQKAAEYIAKKSSGFRLNFFIDEVGQYISGDAKLMLNLQTIAESLATKCKGQSWIFATAQEDLQAIVGDRSAIDTNDFSKIQGRFKIRISLTSANVDEVIEKRLLAKTEESTKSLTEHFKKEGANLSTILTLSETGVQFRKFKDEKEFISKFPFIPYQFDLFQQCIRELSKHNAFQGKHASVGERSMLGVFQQILKGRKDITTSSLISFDQMFEGIRSTIRGEIQNAITQAERNINNELANRVLKALFLVKYYSNFQTSKRNVSVMMLSSSDTDLKQHEHNIQEALNLLESQTYVQRNGELYEFLTDDEKDVENEIKSTEVDNQQVTTFLNEVLFDTIIGDNRIRFEDNKQDYEFTKKIDGVTLGREKELTIEILTPNSENYGREEFYQGHTMGYNTLALFVLPETPRLLQDVMMFLRTDKYCKRSMNQGVNPSIQMILMEKQRQNVELRRQLINQLRSELGLAAVYIYGTKQDVGNSQDGKTKVINGFQKLIRLAYPNLRMLGSIQFNEDIIKNTIRKRQDDLFGGDDATMSEPENEILGFILRRKKQSDRTSITDLREHFSKKPYGWYTNAILCIVARLYKRVKIEARQDSNILSDEDFLANLLNNRSYSNTLLEPQMEFEQDLVRRLKDIYYELFNEPVAASEARDVALLFKQKAKTESRELYQLIGNKLQYPFLEALSPLATELDRLGELDYAILINQVRDFENQLLDWKEDLLDPILKFWNGDQKKIFDRVILFLNGDQSNFEYIDGQELTTLKEVRKHPKPFDGDVIKRAKEAIDALDKKVSEQITIEKAFALEKVHEALESIKSKEGFAQMEEKNQKKVLQPLEQLAEKVSGQRYISTLRQYINKVPDMTADQLTVYEKLLNPEKIGPEYITKDNVVVTFPKNELANEQDVISYTEVLKEELLKQINLNKRIRL